MVISKPKNLYLCDCVYVIVIFMNDKSGKQFFHDLWWKECKAGRKSKLEKAFNG